MEGEERGGGLAWHSPPGGWWSHWHRQNTVGEANGKENIHHLNCSGTGQGPGKLTVRAMPDPSNPTRYLNQSTMIKHVVENLLN